MIVTFKATTAALIGSGSSWRKMLYLCLLFFGVLFCTGCCQGATERPAIHFCQFSGDLIKVFSDTLEQFKKVHQEAMVESEGMTPFSTGTSRFSFPFATIFDGELHNAQNLYIAEGSNINCDDKQMNVKINFGIRDAIVKAKFSTPFGIEGDTVVTMSHFEADVIAVLPRKSNKIEIKKVVILKMEDVHLEVKTQSPDSPQMDFSKIANSFLKTTPKGVLYPLISTFVKRFAQQYLDENPLPF